MFWNQYPYINLNDLNLDFLLKAIGEMQNEVKNFVTLNAVKYADPIQWDISNQYEKNTIVIDPLTGTAYISVQPVPSGVALNRTDYWTPVFDLSRFITQGNENLTEHVEGAGVVYSTFALNQGDWVIWNGVLYKALVNIPIGTAYSVNSNIERVTVEDYIKDILTEIANEIQARIDADNDLQNDIGDIDNLITINKTNLVSAINEIANAGYYVTPQMFGAVGDGVTNDTQAFIDCFAGGNKFVYIPEGTYYIDNRITIGSNTKVVCNGTILARMGDNVPTNIDAIFYGNNISNVSIDGLKVVGSGAIEQFYARESILYFTNSQHIDIKNCNIKDIPYQYAIQCNICDFVNCENCYIENYTYAGIGFSNGCNNVVVKNNSIIESVIRTHSIAPNSYPISVSGFDYSVPIVIPENIVVDGNFIYNSVAFWEGIDFHGGSHVTVVNNIIIGCINAISCAAQTNFPANDVIISNNNLIGPGNSFIEHNAGAWPISLSYCTNAIISGNKAHGFAKSTAGSASPCCMYISYSTNVVIEDNEIWDCGNNFPYCFYFPASDNIVLQNNYIHDCEGQMFARFANTTKAVIKGNTIQNACQYFINYSGITAAQTSYIRCVDNVVDVDDYNNDVAGAVPQTSTNTAMNNRTAGHKGDIVYNVAPASGVPIGWICIASATSTTPASWIRMANFL